MTVGTLTQEAGKVPNPQGTSRHSGTSQPCLRARASWLPVRHHRPALPQGNSVFPHDPPPAKSLAWARCTLYYIYDDMVTIRNMQIICAPMQPPPSQDREHCQLLRKAPS